MKKTILLLNFLLLIALIINTVCFNLFNLFPFKCLASTCFVLLSIINLVYAIHCKSSHLKVCILMVIGIIFAMGGDISINFNFILGAIVFALGHIFYLITYCTIRRIKKWDFAFMLIIFIAISSFLFLTPIFDFGDATMPVIIAAYCIIISSMTAKSITNAYALRTKSNLLFACGSIMFFFSDIMLVLNLFANTSELTYILCHSIYFPGQWILAHAIYHLANE